MTAGNTLQHLQNGPARIGQGTAAEQSRAVAEVFAAAELAMRSPRNEQLATERLMHTCSQLEFARGAEFALPQGGDVIIGESVELAREAARVWGNISHGVVELLRDDDHRQSEMLAYAWDVETNTRSARTFIVPHAIDAGGSQRSLTRLAAITNQNNAVAARQLREVIFSVLPNWLIARAVATARATIEADVAGTQAPAPVDAGRQQRPAPTQMPLPGRRSAAVERFAGIGVTLDDLQGWLQTGLDQWSARQVGQLGTLFTSIERGQVTVEETFGARPPSSGPAETLADLQGPPAAAPAAAEWSPEDGTRVDGEHRPPTSAERAVARAQALAAGTPAESAPAEPQAELDLEPTDAEREAAAAREAAENARGESETS
jgi:hypothetical protein